MEINGNGMDILGRSGLARGRCRPDWQRGPNRPPRQSAQAKKCRRDRGGAGLVVLPGFRIAIFFPQPFWTKKWGSRIGVWRPGALQSGLPDRSGVVWVLAGGIRYGRRGLGADWRRTKNGDRAGERRGVSRDFGAGDGNGRGAADGEIFFVSLGRSKCEAAGTGGSGPRSGECAHGARRSAQRFG